MVYTPLKRPLPLSLLYIEYDVFASTNFINSYKTQKQKSLQS